MDNYLFHAVEHISHPLDKVRPYYDGLGKSPPHWEKEQGLKLKYWKKFDFHILLDYSTAPLPRILDFQ